MAYDPNVFPGIAVKITLYNGCCPEHVVYFRYNLPMHIVEKWKWYFEYLAALVKIHKPRQKVELRISVQEVLCGSDFIREKTKNLLRARKIKLKKTRTGLVDDDLFGFNAAEKEATEKSIIAEIEALERGEYHGYVPPTYINRIKEFTNHGTQSLV